MDSVLFSLSHKIVHDGLNPIYLRVEADLVDTKVVFNVEEVTGEWRQTLNYRHEVEEADRRPKGSRRPIQFSTVSIFALRAAVLQFFQFQGMGVVFVYGT